jgi:hypothetical protein
MASTENKVVAWKRAEGVDAIGTVGITDTGYTFGE